MILFLLNCIFLKEFLFLFIIIITILEIQFIVLNITEHNMRNVISNVTIMAFRILKQNFTNCSRRNTICICSTKESHIWIYAGRKHNFIIIFTINFIIIFAIKYHEFIMLQKQIPIYPLSRTKRIPFIITHTNRNLFATIMSIKICISSFVLNYNFICIQRLLNHVQTVIYRNIIILFIILDNSNN